jgi:formylglycine-generating enzyme required for sulfatase activity
MCSLKKNNKFKLSQYFSFRNAVLKNINQNHFPMKNRIVLILIAVVMISTTVGAQKKTSGFYFKVPEGFAFIPGGIVRLDTAKNSVQAFCISKTEVTNKQYREFLSSLLQKGDTADYRKAMVDSTKWRDKHMYNEPFVEFYFRHPAYDEYPVVNVPREGAEMYCKWLSEKLSAEDTSIKVEFRLPFQAEWVLAARGGNELAEYAWEGPYLMDEKGKWRCNFKCYSAESIHYNAETQSYEIITEWRTMDNVLITGPVESYEKNGYGLYNMSGNAAEMLQEDGVAAGGCWNSTGYDVRAESLMKYQGPSPFVGFRPVITYLGK